jgi:hypothetical protein
MKKLFKQKNILNKKGFTLLFAVLVSTLILAVGASIISVALKQIILSGSARDSQFAFYASNSGIECALYWDFVGIENDSRPIFATSSNSELAVGTISCANSDIEISGPDWDVDTDVDSATTTFRVEISEDVPYCVDIEVAKWDDSGELKTAINSRGYNTCNEDDRRRIERGLRINY